MTVANVNQRQFQRGKFQSPRQGLIFDTPPPSCPPRATTRCCHCPARIYEPRMLTLHRNHHCDFFPRLFRINPLLTQTLMYGHFIEPRWLNCNLYDIRVIWINLRFDEICFLNLLGWPYLEYCESLNEKSNKKMLFSFDHFGWWCRNVNGR